MPTAWYQVIFGTKRKQVYRYGNENIDFYMNEVVHVNYSEFWNKKGNIKWSWLIKSVSLLPILFEVVTTYKREIYFLLMDSGAKCTFSLAALENEYYVRDRNIHQDS